MEAKKQQEASAQAEQSEWTFTVTSVAMELGPEGGASTQSIDTSVSLDVVLQSMDMQIQTDSGPATIQVNAEGHGVLAFADGGGEVPPPEPEGDWIEVNPGDDVQALINEHGEGAAFLFNPGTYAQVKFIPKSNQTFEGLDGVIFDGQDTADIAIRTGNAPYPSNVTIRNLRVTHYNSPDNRAAIEAGLYSTEDASDGWLIENCEVDENNCIGVRIGNNAIVRNCNLHHNHCLNIGGSGNNALVENNEISFGDYAFRWEVGYQGGGSKFCLGDGLVVRNNYWHDNEGPSIWLDENTINTLIEGNTVENGATEGIVVEICYNATIRGNTVKNCGWRDPHTRYDWLWDSGIAIHSSPGCEVYENTLEGNWGGICGHQQDRHTNEPNPPVHGQHVMTGLYVHDNHITQTNVPSEPGQLCLAAGAADDSGNKYIFSEDANNRFENNTYVLGEHPRYFAWDGGDKTQEQWESYGLS